MKKSKLIIISTLALSALISCGESSEESSPLNEAILLARSGYRLDGMGYQSREMVVVDAYGDPIYDEDGNYHTDPNTYETNEFSIEIIFEEGENKGFYKRAYTVMDDEEYDLTRLTYFADEEGYAYTTSVNYRNEVVRNYSSTGTTYYSNGFDNIFNYIEEDDLTLVSGTSNVYQLSENKAGYLTNNLLYFLSNGYYGIPETFTLTLNGNQFSELNVVMNGRLASDTSDYINYYLYEYNNSSRFVFSNFGSAVVPTTSVAEDKPDNAPLRSALDKIGDNYTLNVTYTTLPTSAGAVSVSTYEDYYFTGSEIAYHEYDSEENSAVDRETDFYLADNDGSGLLQAFAYDAESDSFTTDGTVSGFPQAYEGVYYYDDFLPIVSEVSEDLFTYNSETNLYEAEFAYNAVLVEDCFTVTNRSLRNPTISELVDEAGNGVSVSIRLNSSDEIEFVRYDYSYLNSSSTLSYGQVTFRYNNVGSTTNPLKGN